MMTNYKALSLLVVGLALSACGDNASTNTENEAVKAEETMKQESAVQEADTSLTQEIMDKGNSVKADVKAAADDAINEAKELKAQKMAELKKQQEEKMAELEAEKEKKIAELKDKFN